MYKNLYPFNQRSFNKSEALIHRACQFLAMIGKNYLPEQEDDSQANLGWDSNQEKVIGRVVNDQFSLILDVKEFALEFVGARVRSSIEIAERTKEEIFAWIKNQLGIIGIDNGKLKYIDHYEVPDHPVDKGMKFEEVGQDDLALWSLMRSNANVLLDGLNKFIDRFSEIRIWPHHLDTGTYYPFGKTRAIGAGWAISDTLCDCPYLYIYGWNGKGKIDYKSLPSTEIGRWIVTESWQGAVVESTELYRHDQQYEAVRKFMETVVDFYKHQLK